MTFQINIGPSFERMAALDPAADQAGKVLGTVIRPGPLKNALTGSWLGHPLHPVLTDVVIGAWGSAWLLDVLGGKKAREAADQLIGIGILSALPTAAAGVADWLDTTGPTRRVGLVHAAANVTGLALFTWSYTARKRGRRLSGFALGTLGAAVASFSAYLGGHLVYRLGTGVNESAFDEAPGEWTAVLSDDALPERTLTGAQVGDTPLLLYRTGATVFALSDRCTHRGCLLHEGNIEDASVVCPCHGSTFRLEDGSIVRGPATAPQPVYDARIRDGQIEVRART